MPPKNLIIVIFMTLILCGGCTTPLPPDFEAVPVEDAVSGPNPMVHQEGKQIVDPEGNPLKLRGVLLEGWLMWNGALWGTGFTSETQITEKLVQLVGEDDFQTFRKGIYDNFITERDIEMIAAMGLNVVRVPINHTVLESPSGAVDPDAIGWKYLDQLLAWCIRHEVYIVLDLHAAPGGQSGVFVADPDDVKLWDSEENQNQTVALWRAIATRYKDEKIIAGYDLLNEPGYLNSADLIEMYTRLIEAVREVDPHHMVIIEGNHLTSDFNLYEIPLSSNQMYSFHTYNFLSTDYDDSQMNALRPLAESQDVPLWNGEFGANNYEWVSANIEMFEDPDNHVNGWIYWPWKKVSGGWEDRWTLLMGIQSTPDWDLTGLFIANPFETEVTLTREQALNGMEEFLTAIRAENLVVDEGMKEVLTSFSE